MVAFTLEDIALQMNRQTDRQCYFRGREIVYSGFQAKWCKTFVVLARLLSNSGCSNPYDNQVWSHTYQLLPIAAINTPVYGHRALGNTNFGLSKKLWYSMASSTTSKPFCLLKHNRQQSRISNLTCLSNLTH